MADDSSVGLADEVHMGEPIAAVQSVSGPAAQSQMVQVAGLDPPHVQPSERPDRRADTQVAERLRQLSLQEKPSDFHDNKVGSPPSDVSLEEVERSTASSQPPQRTDTGSSAESDEELKEKLQAASSPDEMYAVCRQYTKDLKGKHRTLARTLIQLLQSAKEEQDKLSALLDAEKEQNRSQSSHLARLEKATTVLQEALWYARRSTAIPDNIRGQLIELGFSEALAEIDSHEVDSAESPAQGSTCPFSDLNHGEFRQILVTNLIQTRGTQCLGCARKIGRIDSHPYGKAILISAAAFALQCKKEDVERALLFWRGDLEKKDPAVYAKAVYAKICTYPCERKAFCGKCDNSTSAWEAAFSKEIKVDSTGTIQSKGKDITKAVLLVQMFRGALFSINLEHYMECQECGRYLKDVGSSILELKRFHEAVCEGSSQVAEKCEQLKPIVFHNTRFPGKVLYPIVVHVKGFGIILYAQIPPFFWAIPAPSCERELTLLDFVSVVEEIAKRCSQEETEFFKNEDARKWKKVISPHMPVLIFPLFQSNCCVQL